MSQSILGLTGLDAVFAFCASVGGILFLIRGAFIVLGFGHDVHSDGHVDIHGDLHGDVASDTDVVHADAVHGDSDYSFKLLTFQGITSFFMIFGLIGLALHYQSKLGNFLSLLGASAAGVGSMWVMGKIFSLMTRLQSSGTLETHQAIGAEATVYLTIPAEGVGKVHVAVQNRLREFDAVTRTGQDLKTGEKVLVISVEGDDVLLVDKF